tara:strand:- start:921 stop:1151 length:231 start_codon:yes stop_codon:yes gene_type:complete
MSNDAERFSMRRNTFFCTNKERHTQPGQVVEEVEKEIVVFGRRVKGWVITTESPLIEKLISIDESLEEENKLRDFE